MELIKAGVEPDECREGKDKGVIVILMPGRGM